MPPSVTHSTTYRQDPLRTKGRQGLGVTHVDCALSHGAGGLGLALDFAPDTSYVLHCRWVVGREGLSVKSTESGVVKRAPGKRYVIPALTAAKVPHSRCISGTTQLSLTHTHAALKPPHVEIPLSQKMTPPRSSSS